MYTREELEEMPSKRLIDIILDMQTAGAECEEMRKRIMTAVEMLAGCVEGTDRPMTGITIRQKPGRKPMTDEERAEAYERQKERQRIKYAEDRRRLAQMKAEEAEKRNEE